MRFVYSFIASLVAFWSHRKEKSALKKGRQLTLQEREIAKRLGVSDISKIRVLSQPKITFPFSGFLSIIARFTPSLISSPIGLTLGHLILVEEAYERNISLIAHELVHVIQYERLGSHKAFLTEYISQCHKYGYKNAPLELEAEETALQLLKNISLA